VGVTVGQWVSVGIRVWVGKSVDVCVGVREVGVNVTVGVLVGVQVGQRVSVGKGVWLGGRVLVNVGEGVEVRVGVSVRTSVLVRAGVLVAVLDGAIVTVLTGEAFGVMRRTGREISPLKIMTTPATIITVKIKASPKYRRPAATCFRRSGQLA
jgi:hypothetical protein